MNIDFKKWLNDAFAMQGKVTYEHVKDILDTKMGFIKNFKIINVVGTNGKGSVTQYINDALIKQGYKVGKFISPHLFRYNERITINNKEITDEDFFNYVDPMLDTFKEKDIMWFGMTYITALKYFQDNDVDFAILEAGVGGRLDPTGFYPGDYGVVTSIGIDHLDYLGTIENIPYEKAGIMNENMKFFIGSNLKEKHKKVFLEVGKEKNAIVKEIDNDGKNYQIRNQKLANGLIKEMTGKDIKEFNTPFGRTTIQKVNGFNVIFDVGHNEDGIKESLNYLKDQNINFDQVIISLSKDKDDSNLESYFDVPIYIYQYSWYGKQKLLQDYKIKGTQIHDILEFIKNIDKDTLIIGSFYLLGEIFNENGKLKI